MHMYMYMYSSIVRIECLTCSCIFPYSVRRCASDIASSSTSPNSLSDCRNFGTIREERETIRERERERSKYIILSMVSFLTNVSNWSL